MFQILFDNGEPSAIDDPAYRPYGKLGFPSPPVNRPWVYSNFVQSLDGITTLLGKHSSGGDISQSREDRWLMDLLRAHADGLLMGMNTLREEQRLRGPDSRGIVFQVVDPTLQGLRKKLGKGRERNIFVTSAADLDLSRHKVFDGEAVDAAVLTSPDGAERLLAQGKHPHVAIIAAGEKTKFDLPRAIGKLREELGIHYLLCEGGPTLYGSLARADLVDDKFMTVSPIEVGQVVPPEQERLPAEQTIPVLLRPTVFGGGGFTCEQITSWTWISCRKAGDHQFNRYRRKRG
ncbi:MAG TPA: dihydrofolate reductase family protein [Terriglobales bacterium]|nr:dihydrofolate reductase family protein [Terriglobales bacterium]